MDACVSRVVGGRRSGSRSGGHTHSGGHIDRRLLGRCGGAAVAIRLVLAGAVALVAGGVGVLGAYEPPLGYTQTVVRQGTWHPPTEEIIVDGQLVPDGDGYVWEYTETVIVTPGYWEPSEFYEVQVWVDYPAETRALIAAVAAETSLVEAADAYAQLPGDTTAIIVQADATLAAAHDQLRDEVDGTAAHQTVSAEAAVEEHADAVATLQAEVADLPAAVDAVAAEAELPADAIATGVAAADRAELGLSAVAAGLVAFDDGLTAAAAQAVAVDHTLAAVAATTEVLAGEQDLAAAAAASPVVGDPVLVTTGQLSQIVCDIGPCLPARAMVERRYLSDGRADGFAGGAFGDGWWAPFEARLEYVISPLTDRHTADLAAWLTAIAEGLTATAAELAAGRAQATAVEEELVAAAAALVDADELVVAARTRQTAVAATIADLTTRRETLIDALDTTVADIGTVVGEIATIRQQVAGSAVYPSEQLDNLQTISVLYAAALERALVARDIAYQAAISGGGMSAYMTAVEVYDTVVAARDQFAAVHADARSVVDQAPVRDGELAGLGDRLAAAVEACDALTEELDALVADLTAATDDLAATEDTLVAAEAQQAAVADTLSLLHVDSAAVNDRLTVAAAAQTAGVLEYNRVAAAVAVAEGQRAYSRAVAHVPGRVTTAGVVGSLVFRDVKGAAVVLAGGTAAGDTAIDWSTVGDRYLGDRVLRSADGSVRATAYNDGSAVVRTAGGEYLFTADGRLRSYSENGVSRVTVDYDADGRVATISDATGGRLDVAWEADRVVRVAPPAPFSAVRYTYADDRLVTVRDDLGLMGVYQYAAGLLVGQGFGDGSTTSIQYATVAGAPRVVAVADEEGVVERFYHDPTNRRTWYEDPAGNLTEYLYDQHLRVVAVVDPVGTQRTFEYSADRPALVSQVVVSAPNAAPWTLRYQYDAQYRVQSIVFDDLLVVRPAVDAVDPADAVEALDIGSPPNPAGDPDAVPVLNRTWNLVGLPDRIDYHDGSSTSFEYDGRRRLTAIRYALPHAQFAEYELFEYDARDRLIFHRDRRGLEQRLAYDRRGYAVAYVDSVGRIMQFAVSDAGPLRWVRLLGAWIRTYDRDAAGRPAVVGVYDDWLARSQPTTQPAVGAGAAVGDSAATGDSAAVGDIPTISDVVADIPAVSAALHQDAPTASALYRIRYDRLGRVVEIVDTVGGDEAVQATLRYNAAGMLIAEQRVGGTDREYRYDQFGRVTAVRADGPGWFEFTYAIDGRLTAVTDPTGGRSDMVCDAQGRLVRRVNAAGFATYRDYDAADRVVRQVTAAGADNRFEYDAGGRLVRHLERDAAEDRERRWTWWPGGRLRSVDDWHLTYPELGLVVATNDRTGAQVHEYRDAAGRVVGHRRADGEFVQFAYGPTDEWIQRDSSWTGTTYRRFDAKARLVSLRTARSEYALSYTALPGGGGRTVVAGPDTAGLTFDYDAAGRLVRRIDPLGHSTTYQYDAWSRLERYTDAAGDWLTRTYDPMGRVVAETGSGEFSRSYTYDAVGRLAAVVDSTDTTALYHYGAGALPTAIGYPDGLHIEPSKPDATDHVADIAALSAHHSGFPTFAYDRQGREVERRFDRPLGGAYVDRSSYDAAGRLVAQVWGRIAGSGFFEAPQWRVYLYDAQNRVSHEIDSRLGVTLIAYDGRGMVAATATTNLPVEQLPATTGSSVDLPLWSMDSQSVTAVRRALAGVAVLPFDAFAMPEPLWVETYEYDAMGNRVRLATPVGDVVYRYVEAGRLAAVVDQRTGERTEYHFDRENRLTAVTASAPAGRPGPPAQHLRYRTDGSISKIEFSNLFIEYHYDVSGRAIYRVVDGPSAAGTQQFGYAGSGRAVATITTAATPGVGAGGLQTAGRYRQISPSAGDTPSSVVGQHHPDRDDTGSLVGPTVAVVWFATPGRGRSYLLVDERGVLPMQTDLRGSPIRAVDRSNDSTRVFAFSLFGTPPAGFPLPVGFAGNLWDADRRLYATGHRDYDPHIGRFTSADPLRDGFNWWIYAGGDPVNYVDAFGLYVLSVEKLFFQQDAAHNNTPLGVRYDGDDDLKRTTIGAAGCVLLSYYRIAHQMGWTPTDDDADLADVNDFFGENDYFSRGSDQLMDLISTDSALDFLVAVTGTDFQFESHAGASAARTSERHDELVAVARDLNAESERMFVVARVWTTSTATGSFAYEHSLNMVGFDDDNNPIFLDTSTRNRVVLDSAADRLLRLDVFRKP